MNSVFDADVGSPEIPADWDPDLRDLMIRFFNKNPTERIRMLQIRVSPLLISQLALDVFMCRGA
jgi:hypothetical protein